VPGLLLTRLAIYISVSLVFFAVAKAGVSAERSASRSGGVIGGSSTKGGVIGGSKLRCRRGRLVFVPLKYVYVDPPEVARDRRRATLFSALEVPSNYTAVIRGNIELVQLKSPQGLGPGWIYYGAPACRVPPEKEEKVAIDLEPITVRPVRQRGVCHGSSGIALLGSRPKSYRTIQYRKLPRSALRCG
jgi:hypothetical protein